MAYKMTKTQLRRNLQKVIQELKKVPCSFWACPGPDKPVENMATCRVCYQIKELRRIIKEL